MKTPIAIASFSCALACVLLALPNSASAAPTLEWIEQFGTSDYDISLSVSTDGLGKVFISGRAWGRPGKANTHFANAFASKYDAGGNLLWTEQLDNNNNVLSYARGYGVTVDGLGNVYISGSTVGSLGEANSGGGDAFVSKYDANGSLLWTEQLGTSSFDISHGVSTDELGNVYISGYTRGSLGGAYAGGRGDAFVSKYDASGNFLWTEQFGTGGDDYSQGVSADGLGNVYVSGFTSGSIEGANAGNWDAFVSKYDTNGSLLWKQQLGTGSDDVSFGVSADGLGNVYISGYTEGSLGGANAGGRDTFISKYNASGKQLWTEQLGTSSDDTSYGVSTDGLGNVYISGATSGSLKGANAGYRDAFISKYDASGNLLWTEQLNTDSDDGSFGVSADGLGNVYITGFTRGSLEGANAGNIDAFLAKFSDPVPEPNSLLLGVMAIVGLALRRPGDALHRG